MESSRHCRQRTSGEYARPGGFFVVLSLLWGWCFDGNRPDRADVLGGAIAIIGVCGLMYWPRGAGG